MNLSVNAIFLHEAFQALLYVGHSGLEVDVSELFFAVPCYARSPGVRVLCSVSEIRPCCPFGFRAACGSSR